MIGVFTRAIIATVIIIVVLTNVLIFVLGIPSPAAIILSSFLTLVVGVAFLISTFASHREQDESWDNERLFDLRREQNDRDPNNPS